MIASHGTIDQIYLDERKAARLACPAELIPKPGQYLLTNGTTGSNETLAHPIYSTGNWPGGFYIATPLPTNLTLLPGFEINLRGPCGHGFNLPPSARKIVLAAMEGNGARLLALLEPALDQNASVVLLCDQPPSNLPPALEILPTTALLDTLSWADYLAGQVRRELLPGFINSLKIDPGNRGQMRSFIPRNTQVLVETPVACGGLADCGVCTVNIKQGRDLKLACKEGPVFDL